MAASRQLTAIMFTDVAGFTELAQADEKGALDLIAELDALVGPLLSMHHGRKVKAMGDGLLIEFPDALNAVQCAFDFQTAVHERNSRRERPPVQLRVGLHLGDVERRGDDIVGDAVNLASRVEPIAEPGGICLSEQVVAQVRNKLPYRFETLGTR
ncbi:MAG: adenylate/guanylate cyclase domain-containing protein, partial [Thermoplasmata archaeon]